MKKILLYIGSMYIGGAQRVMANLANYFCADGYDVVLVNEVVPIKGKKTYVLDNNIKRIYLDNTDGSNFIKRQKMRIFNLRSIIKKERPDIVLSFLGPANIRMLLATVGVNNKKVVSVRNDPNKEYGKGFKRIISRQLFKLADGCVFQTKDAADYFPDKVKKIAEIIYNPVNEVFYHTQRGNIKKEIIYVGRLVKQKNPLLLINAFARIAKNFPEWNVVFCGEGELKVRLINECKALGLEERVYFVGEITNVAERLSEAGIYVLSSNYEGMPNSLMEAMAVGLPCISTDCPCGGPKELIEDKKNGILVPVGNEFKMAEALSLIMDNQNLREELGKNARIRALEFKYDVILKKWKDYLDI